MQPVKIKIRLRTTVNRYLLQNSQPDDADWTTKSQSSLDCNVEGKVSHKNLFMQQRSLGNTKKYFRRNVDEILPIRALHGVHYPNFSFEIEPSGFTLDKSIVSFAGKRTPHDSPSVIYNLGKW